MDDLVDSITDRHEGAGNGRSAWLDWAVPITLALIAIVLTISKTIDDNIVQDILARNQDKASLWGLYDETSIKEKLYYVARRQIEVQMTTTQAAQDRAFAQALRKVRHEFLEEEEYYGAEKAHIRGGKENKTPLALAKKKKAKPSDEEFTSIEEMDRKLAIENRQDDWFDRSDAAFSMALAFLAICALMKNRWLYFASVALGLIGTALALYADSLPNLMPK